MSTRTDLIVEQGSTFSTNVTVSYANNTLYNLTGYTANSVFRKHFGSNTYVSFTTTIDVNTSIVTLSLTANQTSNVNAGRYVYDLVIDNGTDVTRVVEGILTITPGVTL